MTLVAEQRGRVVAAAHLLRYGGGGEVGESSRDTAEINWLLFWPRATHGRDSEEAAGALMDVCLAQLRSWGAVGFIEVETNLAEGGRLAHLGGWADVGNLHKEQDLLALLARLGFRELTRTARGWHHQGGPAAL